LCVVFPVAATLNACTGDRAAPADSASRASGTTASPAGGDSSHDSAAHAAPAPVVAGPPKIDPANVAASLEWDAATKTAKLPMVSGVGSTAGGWNFNGHAHGTLILTVPVGSTVEMMYYNDDIVPHSLGVVAGSPTSVPSSPSAPAFPNAITVKFEQGMMTNEKDPVRFVASKAGTYLIVCGVPGHAASGMWVVLVVSASAKAATVRVTS
jgi:sulfocyanin